MSRPTVVDAIDNWEEAGTQLENALKAYLDSCSALESSVIQRPSNPNQILSRIGRTKDPLHARVSDQLSQSKLSLARAHNWLGQVVYQLPDEILAYIFWISITDATKLHPYLVRSLRSRYKCLYRLVGVCSTWRRVGLSQGVLWSLVPWFGPESTSWKLDAMKQSLERAGGSDLHLAGHLSVSEDFMLPALAEYAPRFCTVNLCSDCCKMIQKACAALLGHHATGRTTDFSICYTYRESGFPPEESDYLFPRNSPQHILFRRFVHHLRVFRISGLSLHWGDLTLTALVEFKIQDVTLGSVPNIYNLLLALASAPNLRQLEIISVEVCVDSTNAGSSYPAVSLPRLKSLYLEDLYQDILELVLSGIARGPHQVTFHCTPKCFLLNGPDGEVYIGAESLPPQPSIDVLIISQEDWIVGNSSNFRSLLFKMPALKSLYLHDQILDQEVLEALVHPPEKDREAGSRKFPQIHTLYLTGCILRDTEDQGGFKEIVTNHGIQELGFSGSLAIPPDHEDLLSFDGEGYGEYMYPFRDWLEVTVPKFTLLKDASELKGIDLETRNWKLW